MDNILFAIWFFLPAGIANGSAVFIPRVPILKKAIWPLDLGKSLKHKRLLGPNKTFGGLILGIIVATIVVGLQKVIYAHSGWIREISSPLNYSDLKIWWLGPILGGGALLGDAIESFFKRQLRVPAGKSWFPFDQIDYVVGGCLLSYFLTPLPAYYYLIILVVWFLIHIVATYIGYLIGVRSKPI